VFYLDTDYDLRITHVTSHQELKWVLVDLLQKVKENESSVVRIENHENIKHRPLIMLQFRYRSDLRRARARGIFVEY
jgi:hypothetical protein